MQGRRMMAALGVALALAAAAPAEAQLGGLGRRIAEKAAGKAAEKAVDKAADRAGLPPASEGSASGGSSSSAPGYTAERVDQFIAAAMPAVEQARKVTAWQAARKEFETKRKARQECINRTSQTITTPPVNVDEELGRFAELQTRLASRMNGASPAEAAVLNDSLEIVGEAMNLAMYPQLKACGERPPFPGADPGPVDTEAVGRRAREAGFSPHGFGMMRERIAAWVLTGSTAGLSPDAVAVLEERRAQLQALEPYFSAVSWLAWGDLGSW